MLMMVLILIIMGMAGEVDQSNYSFKVEGLHLATGGHMGGIKGFYEFTLEGTLGAAAGWLACRLLAFGIGRCSLFLIVLKP